MNGAVPYHSLFDGTGAVSVICVLLKRFGTGFGEMASGEVKFPSDKMADFHQTMTGLRKKNKP